MQAIRCTPAWLLAPATPDRCRWVFGACFNCLTMGRCSCRCFLKPERHDLLWAISMKKAICRIGPHLVRYNMRASGRA